MLTRRSFTFPALSIAATGLAGCGSRSIVALPEIGQSPRGLSTRTLSRPNYAEVYTEYPGERFPIMAIDYQRIDPRYLRQTVAFPRDEKPGSIVVDPAGYHLYFVESPRVATRYGVGVGREGFGWQGVVAIGSKQKWPRWFPPKEMIAREAARGHNIPDMMEGQIGNPLGARALYLYDGPKDTLFRIHGTFDPKSIGTNASSGCIRMANADVMDLYERVKVGTRVVVR